MKKLGKLSINPERIMKNEELVNLRGGDYYGYEYGCGYCWCLDHDGNPIGNPIMGVVDIWDCREKCVAYKQETFYVECIP